MARIYKANQTGMGSIALPKKLLEKLNWEIGDEVIFKIDEYGRLVIQNIYMPIQSQVKRTPMIKTGNGMW